MDRAIELNPNDYEVIGYIGRWCYEVIENFLYCRLSDIVNGFISILVCIIVLVREERCTNALW